MTKPGPPKGTELNENQKRTQFKKGQSGNPKGMTSAVAKRIYTNAEKATFLREQFLNATQSRIATIEVMAAVEADGDLTQEEMIKGQRIMALLSPDVNRLMTDSENRGMGAPKQRMDIDDKRDRDPEDITDEELAAIASGSEEQEDEDEHE